VPKSGPAAPPAPDLVRRRFVASRPDERWLADITHVPTWEGWLFLSVVMDVCTRKIVGWSMREDHERSSSSTRSGWRSPDVAPTGE
jgi:putative transposase